MHESKNKIVLTFLFIFFIELSLKSMQSDPVFLAYQNDWAQKTLESLTTRQKIAQLFVVAAASNFAQSDTARTNSMSTFPYDISFNYIQQMIEQYQVGGLIFLYKSDPITQMQLMKIYQKMTKIPLLIVQDSEWGLAMRLDLDSSKLVRYPRNMTLGALTDETYIYELGNEIGKQCAAIGVHMNLAPVVDVNSNSENPVIHDRSFGDDPVKVARLASLFAYGLQDAGVLACIKHFPGHGDTIIDSHVDLPVLKQSKKRLESVELFPFKSLIKEGVSAVMSAHLFVEELDNMFPSSMSYFTITDLLKKSFGFKGLVVTDGLGMGAVTKNYEPGELELQAFLAGNDILLCPLDVPRAIDLIEQQINTGQISKKELDVRVLKILRAKAWVLAKQEEFNNSDPENFLVRQEAYALQEKLYRNAITIAKNAIPLQFGADMLKNSHIIQIGILPEELFAAGCQFGIQKYTSAITSEEVKQCVSSDLEKDIVIIAIGQMNKSVRENFGISNNVFLLINRLKEMGKTVVILLFGTPYTIPLFHVADVIIEAYEDVPVVQKAVLDVLKGDLRAKGALPIRINSEINDLTII